jgi:hypothetical protein
MQSFRFPLPPFPYGGHEGVITKARGVENHPSAKMRGTPKSLRSENHTKSQWNARNSSKVLYIIEKKQI